MIFAGVEQALFDLICSQCILGAIGKVPHAGAVRVIVHDKRSLDDATLITMPVLVRSICTGASLKFDASEVFAVSRAEHCGWEVWML